MEFNSVCNNVQFQKQSIPTPWGGGGVLDINVLEAKYKAELEFLLFGEY